MSSLGDHPFDMSCVEADMVAKTFGRISDLGDDSARSIWQDLLLEVGAGIQETGWDNVRLQFSPYPPHHRGTGREIGDFVLLDPTGLNVVFEVKRPFVSEEDTGKVDRAIATAGQNGWPEPTFVLIGTQQDPPTGVERLLEWSCVANVFSAHGMQRISTFIHRQVELQREAEGLQSSGSFSQFGGSSATIEDVFEEPTQRKLAQQIVAMSPFDLKCRATGYANLSMGKRAFAQLHPHPTGVALAVREADHNCPQPQALSLVPVHELHGYRCTNKSWLAGDGKRFTNRPAKAFLLPFEMAESPAHPGWQDAAKLLEYALGHGDAALTYSQCEDC